MTIEERAEIEERADKYVERLASSFLGFPDILEGGKNGYIVGAAEQKRIDIDKACEWLKQKFRDKDGSIALSWLVFLDEFKEAMKDKV